MKVSWSKSGRLLASGSDDQHLNIHTYQSDSSTAPFALTATIATGHSANIFSVKFMPHSNDRTLVTCAGDSEVRIFDIEHSGRSTIPSSSSNMAAAGRAMAFDNLYRGVRYLDDGNTNARVYRSHADRVKRIVTESSPHLFLTCSEDGEVRQWDLRLPSSAYPAPKSGRGFMPHRLQDDNSNVPPPLISYKRHHLDLNTISCSTSQPHYIALGGAHLHCFLHDRRMLGRDCQEERGKPASASLASEMSEHDDVLMGQATRCVRRFAPRGQKKMRRTDDGHITACKISDANPNQMIVSWSGDHIYSFDLVKTADIGDSADMEAESISKGKGRGKVKESRDRNRKRRTDGSATSREGARRGFPEPRRAEDGPSVHDDLALRVRYENGQSEDFSVGASTSQVPRSVVEGAREAVLSESQKRSLRIAKSVVRIRKLMFSLDDSSRTSDGTTTTDLTFHTTSFTSALGLAAACLPEMDEIMRTWRYPVNPTEEDVILQKTFRSHRDASRRFVQAAGTLARVLGGKLRTASPRESPLLRYFHKIEAPPHEGPHLDEGQIFCFDFLEAILLWLEAGPQALMQALTRPTNRRNEDSDNFTPNNAQLSDIDDYLIPSLLKEAQDRFIPNVDASRFERDEYRKTFESEKAAVIAFSHAVRIPFEDLSRAIMPASSSADGGASSIAGMLVQDKTTALKYWGFKVCRGLLMNAGSRINFAFVDRAFGGSGVAKGEDEGRVQEDVEPEEVDEVVNSVSIIKREANEDVVMDDAGDEDQDHNGHKVDGASVEVPSVAHEGTVPIEEAGSDQEVILMDDLHNEIADHMAAHRTDSEDSEEGDQDDDSDEDDEENQDITASERQFMWQSASDRGKLRESVEKDVPCFASSRSYRGHCNVKTVKDVNFFGLQDEYVVSGSDSGHLFIWDRKTSQLVNILEGDSEVVNVVQGNYLNLSHANGYLTQSLGHPYEPLLAVSGIDHTIKIFSPDTRAQDDARNGINLGIAPDDSAGHSFLSASRLRSQRRRPAPHQSVKDNAGHGEAGRNNGGLASRKRMHESYQIVSQNDVDRQGSMRNSFITVRRPFVFRLRTRAIDFNEWSSWFGEWWLIRILLGRGVCWRNWRIY